MTSLCTLVQWDPPVPLHEIVRPHSWISSCSESSSYSPSPTPPNSLLRSWRVGISGRRPEDRLHRYSYRNKNIPFGFPEEDFKTQLFAQLRLVPPYAFNYHRNKSDGTFHGLAFANFNAPYEAQAAVDALNNFKLEGRRLRVEVKKRLPMEEEERQRLARQSRRQLTHNSLLPTTFGGGQRCGSGGTRRWGDPNSEWYPGSSNTTTNRTSEISDDTSDRYIPPSPAGT